MEKPVIIEGRVVGGLSLGRKLGFPTANIMLPPEAQRLRDGVYFGRATLPGGDRYYALINVGNRPTVSRVREPLLEAYLIGFSGSLYEEVLRVELLEYMRGERKFDDLEGLKRAMEKDLEKAEQLIEKYGSGL